MNTPSMRQILGEIARLTETVSKLEQENELQRIQLAACGVLAMSNTEDSLKQNYKMKPEYLCASVQDVHDAVLREIALRKENVKLKQVLDQIDDIQTDDGVANLVIAQAAERIDELAKENRQLKECIDTAIEMIKDGDDAFDLDLDMCCNGLLSAVAQDIGFYHRTTPEIKAQAIEKAVSSWEFLSENDNMICLSEELRNEASRLRKG